MYKFMKYYFLLGIRNLFLRSNSMNNYIVSEANYDNYTQEYAQDENVHSI